MNIAICGDHVGAMLFVVWRFIHCSEKKTGRISLSLSNPCYQLYTWPFERRPKYVSMSLSGGRNLFTRYYFVWCMGKLRGWGWAMYFWRRPCDYLAPSCCTWLFLEWAWPRCYCLPISVFLKSVFFSAPMHPNHVTADREEHLLGKVIYGFFQFIDLY